MSGLFLVIPGCFWLHSWIELIATAVNRRMDQRMQQAIRQVRQQETPTPNRLHHRSSELLPTKYWWFDVSFSLQPQMSEKNKTYCVHIFRFLRKFSQHWNLSKEHTCFCWCSHHGSSWTGRENQGDKYTRVWNTVCIHYIYHLSIYIYIYVYTSHYIAFSFSIHGILIILEHLYRRHFESFELLSLNSRSFPHYAWRSRNSSWNQIF